MPILSRRKKPIENKEPDKPDFHRDATSLQRAMDIKGELEGRLSTIHQEIETLKKKVGQ